jgi:two-component system, chemotaxis family, sensor kinase CheA
LLPKFVEEGDEHLTLVEATLVAIEANSSDSAQIAEAFRAIHSFKGNCGICGLSDLEQLSHKAETLFGKLQLNPTLASPSLISLLLEVVDVSRHTLAKVLSGNAEVRNLDGWLDRLETAILEAENRTNSGIEESGTRAAVKADVQYISEEVSLEPIPDIPSQHRSPETSIRVDTEKLDLLMNLVGELIIAETTVTKNPDLEGYDFENFQKAALNLNRLTRSLQEVAMAVRMMPIAGTFRKMVRLVRDVSSKQGKSVELVTSGENTEIDKTVVESISDPLVHLIRNAVDHGIEDSSERVAQGKSATGCVWLEARHQGGEVLITLRDDGRGLDLQRILKTAVDRKLADPTRRYSDREIIDFIFAPGFSTARAVTDISGRGVGMDVVRCNIEGIGGRIETTSEVGHGTTFTLRIPLTLAIIEGMLVRVGKSHYTIPLLTIRESVKARRQDITATSDGCELLKLRKRHYPILRLHAFHSIENAQESIEEGTLVIVEAGEKLACLLVDEVVGQCQTVIKGLPEYLRRIKGLSGCSILHNGDISLILDIETFVGAAQNRAA